MLIYHGDCTPGPVLGIHNTASYTLPKAEQLCLLFLVVAASFLGGLMRMSASMCLILMEMTGAPTTLPFLMMSLVIAKGVGDRFNYRSASPLYLMDVDDGSSPVIAGITVVIVISGPSPGVQPRKILGLGWYRLPDNHPCCDGSDNSIYNVLAA